MKNHRIIAGALVDTMALCLVIPTFAADGTVNFEVDGTVNKAVIFTIG